MAQNAAKNEIANDVVRMPLKTVIDNAPVGAILHDARIAAGQDLAHVSERLRIRRVYIEAIEESRLADLPGLPYAIGFVRAYADHLGLDTAKLVEKFKQEASDLESKTQLVLPEPIAVGRTPTGPVVFLSLLLLACAYGGWLYVSNKDAAQIDLIPPLPDSIAHLLSPDATAPEDTAPTENVSEAAATPEPDSTTVQVEAQPPRDAAPVLESATEPAPAATVEASETPATEETSLIEAAPEATEPGATTPEPTAQEIAAAPTEIEAVEPAPIEISNDPAVAETTTEQAAIVAPAQTSVEEETAAAVARTEPAPAPATEPAPQAEPLASAAPLLETSAPVVYGAENTDSRVVIVARGPVWVEVTAPNGDVLLTRLLNDGDRFQTPNTEGLTLVTGNAGGLEFLVDGAAAPDIGPPGAVRRDVSLDPDALLRGPDPAAQ